MDSKVNTPEFTMDVYATH